MDRKPLGNKLRFEVFKRDSFTCQYCGSKAPDVVLHVDHVVPVAEGGVDDLLNLVTACVICNSGKGARLLSDDAVIVRQMTQLQELEERRQQLEMMMQWQRGLQDIDADACRQAMEFWYELVPGGFVFSDEGGRYIARLIAKHGLDEVLSAMRISASKYVRLDLSGSATSESWTEAADYIGRICRTSERGRTDPYAQEIAYVCGILRKRLRYWNAGVAADDIRAAYSWGASFDEVKGAAVRAASWSHYRGLIADLIYQHKGDEG